MDISRLHFAVTLTSTNRFIRQTLSCFAALPQRQEKGRAAEQSAHCFAARACLPVSLCFVSKFQLSQPLCFQLPHL